MYYFDFDYESTERYDAYKYLDKTEGTIDILTSYFIIEVQKLNSVGIYKITTEAYRPDLLSYRIYGHVQYWWILLLYNNIISYNELEINKEILFPSLEDIEDLYFSLRAKGLEV